MSVFLKHSKVLKLAMPYIKDTYELGDCRAYEYKFVGRNGAKGEKRAKRQKATPEQIKRQNQWTRKKKMTYTIIANFKSGDVWTTLKYPKGTKPDPEQMKKDFKKFQTEMRKSYKKCNKQFKFISRMEIGKNGGPHIHILVNHIDNIDLIIKECWKKAISYIAVPGNNYVNLAPFDEDGAAELARYITELPKNKGCEGQLNIFSEEERKVFCKTSSSRNLIRPEAERKRYLHWTLARIWRDGLKPTKGYYIVKNSVKTGVNKVTGYSYIYYIEKKLPRKEKVPQERVKIGFNEDESENLYT